MPTWICLLRGVNLGARNKLNMAELRTALGEVGVSGVRTHLQSGNVIMKSRSTRPDRIITTVGDVLRDRFELDVPVIVRTPQQLRDLLAWCPYRSEAAEQPATVHLIHLAARPDPDRVATVIEQDWSPDQIAIDGSDVAISYATSMHGSRLQHRAVLRRLGVDGTARNWRTAEALAELTADA